ncbi:forkhead transcription factor-like protein [Dendryphion nanum]|uniref:Forkhead transcription factor-like protein n=1 Tax=Dendryphion nanum TaxID=256645 RepID=A0A9P9DDA5_9PLEO|nr:forkhead transcription factor-like protein [Dendryphion nanum]
MATTRRQPALQIFQDPIRPRDQHQVAHYESHLNGTFAPVTDVSNDHHTLLEPPQFLTNGPSPRKTRHRSSSPPPSALAEKGLNTLSIPPPQEQNFRTDAPMKRPQHPIPHQSQVMAGSRQPMFAQFQSHFDKENLYTAHGFADLSAMPPAEPPVKIGHKRTLTDTAPLRDRSKKQKVASKPPVEEDLPLPDPHQMPPVDDDGTKPPYSYANLIGMAILRAHQRRLTLAQIYKWIADTFAFYRNSPDGGWQNSIRHNLSLSKSFSKQERPKDDPGKGHYWVINPGFEKQYHKAKSTRRPTNPEGFLPTYPSDTGRPSTSSATFPPPLNMLKSIDSSKFPEDTELSSDATIPCSDAGIHDGQDPDQHLPPSRQIPSSPPPADIHSSPPPAVSRSIRQDTPPRVPRFPTHSSPGGRKRKFNGLGDSGYYSSIESSAIKGNALGPLLTSEADLDRPSIKRGRAEEEIARIRGSSYDSPTKARPFQNKSNPHLTSSPPRAGKKNTEGPLTPAIVFKRPALPPASASPNTNLRNHRMRMRELVGGSPDKSMPVWVDTSFLNTPNWSPAVRIPNEENVNLVGNGFDSTFDIFNDYDYQESPLKRSTKRPRLERAATTTGILADITGSKPNLASPTPNWKSPFLNIPSLSPTRHVSPSKAPTSVPIPDAPLPLPKTSAGHSGLTPTQTFDAPQDDDIFHLIHSDESEPGIDLLQGFQKIGARQSVASNGSPSKGPRPALARSSTTRF